MGRLLWDAGWVTEASFLLRWRRLFPLQHRSPGEFSPIDIWVDWRVLEERLEFHSIVVSGIEESFERPNAGAFFLEKLDNCFSFSLVGGGGVRR